MQLLLLIIIIMFNVSKTNEDVQNLNKLENHGSALDLPVFSENSNPSIIFQPQLGDGPNGGTRRPIPVSTVDWQTTNVSQFIPMHGLDFLGGAEQLHIQQTVELNDLLSNKESENRYIIRVPNGETLYYASESSTPFQRTCFGSARAFSMKLFDQSQQEAIEIRRRLACGTCSFWCYLQVIEVYSKPTDYIGAIEQQFNPSIPVFFVYNEQRSLLYRIEGPSSCACVSFAKDAHFKIYTADGMTQLGSINHQWDQILVAYNLSIQFPGRSTDNKHKALLLGAAFLLEYMYFENSKKRGCRWCTC